MSVGLVPLFVYSLCKEGLVAQKYLLPCSCGQIIPVETSQAGEDVTCSCGLTVRIPTMLKIKKLPLLEDELTDYPNPSHADDSPERIAPSPASTKAEASSRVHKPLLNLGLVLLVAFSLFTAYVAIFTYPKPRDVLKARVEYTFGNKTIYQNSTPIPYNEMAFLYYPEEAIDDFYPDEMMRYWRLVNTGPAMSLNFRENFQSLVYYYYLRCFGAAVLIGIALSLIVTSFFVGKPKTVAARKGTDWR